YGGTAMKRFFLATALAVAGALASADKADAQVVYGYNTYVPSAGVVVGGTNYITPYGVGTRTAYYSPFTGVTARETYYTDVFGNEAARVGVYNPWVNLGYRSGYIYSPPTLYPSVYGPVYSAPYVNR